MNSTPAPSECVAHEGVETATVTGLAYSLCADFAQDQRERLLAGLGRDCEEARGWMARVKFQCDELEMAMTANEAKRACYLDVGSGEVLMVVSDGDRW